MAKTFNRYAVTAAAVAVLAGGAVTTASPAQAVGPTIVNLVASPNAAAPTTLIAHDIVSAGPLGATFNFPVSISRLIDGSAQVVASGKGTATYQCNGSAINTYTAVGKELTVPCG
jgi:hypothetical protein